MRGQAYRLEEQDTSYDFDQVILGLRRICEPEDGGTGLFSWTHLGREVGCLFREVPFFAPLLGQVDKVPRLRKQSQRKERANNKNIAVEAPLEVQQSNEGKDDNANEINEATNDRIHRLYNVMRQEQQRAKPPSSPEDEEEEESGVPQCDLLQLLVNPKDNIQTVENFFDFSFLIKDKRVVESMDGKGLPQAMVCPPDTLAEGAESQRKQLVLSLSMKDLNEIKTLLQLQCETLHEHALHRSDELYLAKDAQEQAEILAARAGRAAISNSNKRKSSSSSQDLAKAADRGKINSLSRSVKALNGYDTELSQ